MCKSLVCKYGFLKKQTKKKINPHANFFPFGMGKHYRAQQLAAMLPFVLQLRNSCHAAGLLHVRIAEASNNIASSSTLFPTSLLLRKTPQNVYRICCKSLTGGISHSPLLVVWGVGWNTEFFTCRWFSVISIFQPKSQTSSLEKNDNCWQNPWHAVSSNANLG